MAAKKNFIIPALMVAVLPISMPAMAQIKGAKDAKLKDDGKKLAAEESTEELAKAAQNPVAGVQTHRCHAADVSRQDTDDDRDLYLALNDCRRRLPCHQHPRELMPGKLEEENDERGNRL